MVTRPDLESGTGNFKGEGAEFRIGPARRGERVGAQAKVWRGVLQGAAMAGAWLTLLAPAPAGAGASTKGVYDVFGEVGPAALAPGGAFQQGSGGIGTVAVTSTGAGGASPGDVYVVDRGDNRIQRFDKDGNFLSTWGLDVDSGGGTGFEICTLAASCKAGLAATGSPSAATGGGLSAPNAVAVDQQNGDVYVADQNNRRIDEFSATGAFLRAWGQNVVGSGAEQ